MIMNRFFVGNRNLQVDVADKAMGFCQHRPGLTGGMNKKRNPAVRNLSERKIDHRRRRFTESAGLHVPRNTDYLESVIIHKKAKTSPNRILVRPELLHHSLVNNGYRRSILVAILFRQSATA